MLEAYFTIRAPRNGPASGSSVAEAVEVLGEATFYNIGLNSNPMGPILQFRTERCRSK